MPRPQSRGPARRASAGRPRRPAKAPPARSVTVTIEGLGAEGDGVARVDGQPVFIDGALPGETVAATLIGDRGIATAIEAPSADRVAPPCPHAEICGGCRLQHLAPVAYAAFKRDRVIAALARARLATVPVDPLVPSNPGSRRRATVALRAEGNRLRLGYHRLRSHEIVDVTVCPLIDPRLEALIAPLRAVLSEMLLPAAHRIAGSLHLSALEDGVSVTLTLPMGPDLAQRERLAAFAAEHDLTGLWWREDGVSFADPIAVLDRGVVRPGGIPIRPDPAGFLQATSAGEATLVDAVLTAAAAAPAGRAVDLYCGIGTFALPLAASGRMVTAVEAETGALDALDAAAKAALLSPKLTMSRRNLAKDPMSAAELAGAAFAVFDPPRAGAAAQAAALADSDVPSIVAVSCNPVTLARDLALLVDGGYRLHRVTPIDQFLWSGHVEVVAHLTR